MRGQKRQSPFEPQRGSIKLHGLSDFNRLDLNLLFLIESLSEFELIRRAIFRVCLRLKAEYKAFLELPPNLYLCFPV